MHFDTDGIYTLQYTAEDSCGNTTTEERTVEVISYRTVLYTDGTFIINESSRDQATNEALHGAATMVYMPFDPNGATDFSKYIFSEVRYRLWHGQEGNVKKVEIGSAIQPTNMAFWFEGFSNTVGDEPFDFTNLDTSNVASMYRTFRNTRCAILDLSGFDTRRVTDMSQMFRGNATAEKIYVSDKFDVSNVSISTSMFGSMSTALQGGAGTTWADTNPTDKTYAHIDGGTADPGYFTAKA